MPEYTWCCRVRLWKVSLIDSLLRIQQCKTSHSRTHFNGDSHTLAVRGMCMNQASHSHRYPSVSILYQTESEVVGRALAPVAHESLMVLSSKNYLPVLLVLIISFTRWSCDGKWTDKRLVHNIHPTSSTGLNNTNCSIRHLASSCISSLREVAPLSPREMSVSVSLLDSVWQNLRDSIVLESILSSEGQSVSSKLSINRDTWAKCKSAVTIEIQGRRILAYNEGINETQRADDWGQ